MSSDIKTQPEKTIVKQSKYRELNSFWKIVISVLTVLGLFLAVNQIFVLRLLGELEFLTAYMYSLLACFISLVFILYPATNKASRDRVPWYDIIFFVVALTSSGYLASQAYNILHKGYELIPPTYLGIIGIILCLLVIEALRRTGGTA